MNVGARGFHGWVEAEGLRVCRHGRGDQHARLDGIPDKRSRLAVWRELAPDRSGPLGGLKHPVRRQIYDHLRLLPGDHFRSVARSLRLAVGTARYHLNALVQDGLIYKQEINGRSRYYVSGGEAEMNRLYARHWEYRDVRLRVLLTLRRMETAQAAEIAKVLGISRQLASYHLRCLEKAGRVRRHDATYRVVIARR